MNHAIILAAGKGQRAKTKVDKMLLPVAGKPLIYYTLIAYNDHPEIDDIVVVCSGKNKSDIQKIVSFYRLNKVKKIVTGGSLRQDSLGKGIAALGKSVGKNDLIAVHNGANPLPSFEEISECLYRAAEEGACIAGHFISSTVKEVDKRHVLKTHDRRKMFAAETPQIAQASLLEKALKQAVKSGKEFTDEAMMMEDVGQKIAYVEATKTTLKSLRRLIMKD